VLAALLEQRQLGLELLEAHAAGALLDAGLVTQRSQLDVAPLRARGDRGGQRARLLEAHRDPITHRTRRKRTAGDRVVALAALRQRQLGLLAPRRDELHLALDQLPRIAHSAGRGLARGEPLAAHAQLLAGQRPASLQRLALEALMQLGRLRLALERTQTAARLAFDVECPSRFSSVALELERRAANGVCGALPRPAASSISSRRSRGLEVTIASTRPWEMTECGLLAEARVREQLEHVDEPAVRAVEPVLTSPARFSRRRIEISLAPGATTPSLLSSTSSTSASLRACTPRPPEKITFLHRLAANRQRRLFASAQSTASVMFDLHRPVGADESR